MGCVSAKTTPLTATLLCNLGPARLKVLQFLLSHGADPNGPRDSRTAVMVAAHNHDVEALVILLAAGGDVNLRNRNGRNKAALHYCVDNFVNFSEAQRVAYEQTAYLLDQAGADVNQASDDGTPLSRSVEFRVHRMVKYLLFANCALEVEPLRDDTRTPLRIAIEKRDMYCVDLLLTAGSRVDKVCLTKARRADPTGRMSDKLSQHRLRSLRDQCVTAVKRRLRQFGHSGVFRFAAAVDTLPIPEIIRGLLMPLEMQMYLDSLGCEQDRSWNMS